MSHNYNIKNLLPLPKLYTANFVYICVTNVWVTFHHKKSYIFFLYRSPNDQHNAVILGGWENIWSATYRNPQVSVNLLINPNLDLIKLNYICTYLGHLPTFKNTYINIHLKWNFPSFLSINKIMWLYSFAVHFKHVNIIIYRRTIWLRKSIYYKCTKIILLCFINICNVIYSCLI